MSDNTDLESRVVAAIRRYREALELAENLEREHACAQRALSSTLLDVERAVRGEAAPHLNNDLFEIGSTAVARSDNTWADLVEATAKLDSARRTLAAVERQLGYLPKVPRVADHK
ncbi:glucose-6-phosphate-specific signal transduction histidine kinase [Bradyrhizobium diazoefficiens]